VLGQHTREVLSQLEDGAAWSESHVRAG